MNPTPSDPTDNLVTFTDDALSAALDLQENNQDFQGLSLRVYIDGKGCDGFYYGVTFDKATKDDLRHQQGNVEIIVDAETAKYIKGSSISWVNDERGKGFLVSNPNHKKFKGKFFKRENWQQRIN